MRIFLCARICFFFLLVLAACASPLDSTPPIIFSRDFVTPSPAPRASVAPLPTLTQNFSATPRVVGSPAPTVPSNFKLLAHNSLDARRNNGGLAIANNCAYVGSRGGAQPIAVLDISNPTQPTLIGRVTLARGMDARELRAVSDLNLLVVMTIDLGANQRAANGVHLYDIRDCRAPKFIAAFDFGDVAPHEFHLWRDPQRPARLLAFVAMFSAARGIQVIDLSDPVRPTRVVEWNYGVTIHSISISDDGTRAFIAAWDAGLLIADSSEIAESKSNPTLRAISHLPYANSSTHSAISIPARRLVILTDENYACPFGWLRVVDIADETKPKIVGEFSAQENSAMNCAVGIFTSHNPLAFKNIILLTWYTGGLYALDVSDAAHPRALANYRAGAEELWSYPIVRDGLIYAVSIEGGLYIFQYAGLFAEEIRAAKIAEGNSNANGGH